MRKVSLAFCLICLSVSFGFAISTDSLYSQAQKLYSQGNFEAAAGIYGEICNLLDNANQKKICQFNEAKSLIESKKNDLARSAEQKLLLLISQTEPSDSLFAELSAEDAKLQLMLAQPIRAVRSWNAAQASANPDYFSELYVLCCDILSAYPDNGLTTETCNKVKPTDTTLISLPRTKIVPLAASSNTQIPKSQTATLQWYVQLGAFSSKGNAEKLVADFKSKGVQLYITELATKKLFVVRTGYFANQEDAKNYAVQKIAPLHKEYKISQ
jgi:septal ring-binding cell division protein DamX